MKTAITIICCVLSVSAFAGIDAPVANYTITSTAIQPTDILGELNDDPEQTALPTSTEKTTIDTNLTTKINIVKGEWKGRKDSAMKRQKSDATLRR